MCVFSVLGNNGNSNSKDNLFIDIGNMQILSQSCESCTFTLFA